MAAPRRRADREEPADGDHDLGPPAEPESVARAILLAKLTAQARSRAELAEALAAKNVPDDAAVAVLDRFEEIGLIDDTAFAAAWVESRQRSKGLGRRALVQELRRKGVDADVIETSVDRIDDERERAAAASLVARKLATMQSVDPAKRFRRLVAMLARKGYSSALAVSVVREGLGSDDLPVDAGLG